MTNPLQHALVPLAEAARLHVGYCHHGDVRSDRCVLVVRDSEDAIGVRLPGANGSLEGEVEVVLGWLAKLGDVSHGGHVKIEYQTGGYWVTLDGFDAIPIVTKKANTLHEALAEAVKALPRDDND